jgi:hypothetical protein
VVARDPAGLCLVDRQNNGRGTLARAIVLSAVALYGRLAVEPAAWCVHAVAWMIRMGWGYHMSVVSKLLVAGGGTDRGPVAVVGPDRVGSVSVAGSVGRRRMIAAGVRSES